MENPIRMEEIDIRIIGSRHDRADNIGIHYLPVTRDEYDALETYTFWHLVQLGMGNGGLMDDGRRLMCFPGEWYPHIPHGFPVIRISFPEWGEDAGVTRDLTAKPMMMKPGSVSCHTGLRLMTGA